MPDETLRPLVILGFPRSGTTLLARLLDGHPDISAPPETGLLSAAGRFLAELTEVEGPPLGGGSPTRSGCASGTVWPP